MARMMVGLLAPTSGSIELDGRSVEALAREDRKALYRKVQMVFQDPLGSLNPRKTVRAILEATVKELHGMDSKGGASGSRSSCNSACCRRPAKW